MKKAFVSWSGGKDSCYAAYLAKKLGIELEYLFTMVNKDGGYSRSHGQSSRMIKLQAEAANLPHVAGFAGDSNYEAGFKKAIGELKKNGVDYGIFGDIEVIEHREWVERVCGDLDITPIFPLWDMPQTDIMDGFISSGFTTVVVAARESIFGPDVLGRTVDREFLKYLNDLGMKVTPCGELGEYHTFITNGPLFNQPIVIMAHAPAKRYDYHVMEITEARLV
ncbi:diphthine--ammonia ligase [Chloroflexota bacterium]